MIIIQLLLLSIGKIHSINQYRILFVDCFFCEFCHLTIMKTIVWNAFEVVLSLCYFYPYPPTFILPEGAVAKKCKPWSKIYFKLF